MGGLTVEQFTTSSSIQMGLLYFQGVQQTNPNRDPMEQTVLTYVANVEN